MQDKTYDPIGGISPVKADVRIIAASNKKIDRLVKDGKFRDDLYYRINVMKLELPSLKERKEDIPLLVDHFIGRFNRLHNKNICCITNEVIAVLLSYDYPGNVRELENIIEHCFVLCEGEIIEAKHLPSSVQPTLKTESLQESEPTTIKQMEIILIKQALKRNKGNKTATAKQLGINKSTLFRKIKAYDIKPDNYS